MHSQIQLQILNEFSILDELYVYIFIGMCLVMFMLSLSATGGEKKTVSYITVSRWN